MEEYSYWIINYISCEGNTRWARAIAPVDWEEWQVREKVQAWTWGCGDDPAEITSIESSCEDDNGIYGYDFTNENE
jgi:hypothetical protein